MANKKNELIKFDSIVQDVLNLKVDYVALSYEEKTDPKIHSALFDAKIIRPLQFSGYAVEIGLFYVHEAYLSKNDNKSKWQIPLDISSPKKGYSYYKAPTIFFDSFEDYYNYLYGDIFEPNDCFYQYHFSNEEMIKFDIKNMHLNYGDRYELKKLDELITSIENSRELRDKIDEIDEIENNEKTGIKLLLETILKSKTWDEYIKSINDLNNGFCKDKNIKIGKLFENSNFQEELFNRLKDGNHDHILKYLFMSIYSPEIDVGGGIFSRMIEQKMGYEVLKKFINYISDHIDNCDALIVKEIFYHREESEYYNVEDYKMQIKNSIERFNRQQPVEQMRPKKITHVEYTESETSMKSQINDVSIEIAKEISKNTDTYSYKENTICLMNYDIDLAFFYHGRNILNKYYRYDFLSEFLYVLDSDLSNMDLTDFYGLESIDDISKINLKGSSLRSSVIRKIGGEVDDEYYKENVNLNEIDFSKNNELENEKGKNLPMHKVNDDDTNDYRIYYISDIHLEHRFLNHGDREKYEIDETMQKIANNIAFTPRNNNYDNIVIINGDICHNQQIYKDFLKTLRNSEHYNTKYFIFTLGNHEYWEYADTSVDEIVAQYSKLIKDCSKSGGSYRLLHNSIIYITYNDIMHEITADQLTQDDDEKLTKELINARLIFFGGTGFAGCNEKYNADCGLYRNTISREQEIEESKKFNDLYEKVCRCAPNKKVIVITHNPKVDWSGNEEYHNGYIYLSGHTHINTYYVSDDYCIYADNQIGYYGYKTSYPKVKYLNFDSSIDIFEFYKDGIYKISEEQYERFLRCKNVVANGYIHGWGYIYMLKRGGYYCFIFETEEMKKLSILNGNTRKRLMGKDIQYYYDNMLNVIHQIDAPLFKYTDLQKAISIEVKRFGGDGKIHGCIIDIDYYNHIYVNPFDYTMTPYHAPNIKERDVYKSVPSLLEDRNPYMYAKYIASGKEQKYSLIVPSKGKSSNKKYRHDEGTYPYSVSRMMSKLQRINKNILTEWIPPIEKEDDGSIKQIGIDECTNDELKQIVKKESEK